MVPQFLVHLSLGLAIACTVGYGYAAHKDDRQIRLFARALYYALVVTITTISGILLTAIVAHNFDYTYVQAYSSRQLEPPYLYASFYSGQEGSFLLWTLLTTLVGVAVIAYSSNRSFEAETMTFYSLVLVFLTLMLVAKNPFAYLWETYANEGTTRELIEAIKDDTTRYNGRGLNPVLQNYWVMFHPPMLFSGFAMMTAPFAFAMAALWKKRFFEWIRLAQPWILATSLVLGIGITLGGLWAYETLGWGGFWAWDPVENSSLVPWLFAVALFHTTLIQRKTQGLVRTNFILVIAAFVAVLYSTFLTRSGILGDTSVHSFVEPGYFVYILLLVFLLSFIALGLWLLIRRLPDIKSVTRHVGISHASSREFLVAIGSGLIVASAAIIVLGTSYPIIAELIGKPKVAIESYFYNTIHLPLIGIVLLVNGMSLIATWSKTNWERATRDLIIIATIAIVLSIAGYMVGLFSSATTTLVAAAALVGLIINVRHVLRLIIAKKPIAIGTFVSHAGLAILTIGIIIFAQQPASVHLRLVEGIPSSAFGYTFTLLGREQVEHHLSDREKYRYPIAVEKNGKERIAYPVVYFSDFNKRQAPFLEPGILRYLSTDLYIAPKALDIEQHSPKLILMRGSPSQLPTDTNWTIELLGFDMSQAQTSDNPGSLKLGARIRLSTNNNTALDTTLFTYFDGNTFTPRPVYLDQVESTLSLINIQRNQSQPERSTVTILIGDPSQRSAMERQVLVVDVSLKPMINLVWCGFLILLAGLLISTIRSFTTAHRSRTFSTSSTQPLAITMAEAEVKN